MNWLILIHSYPRNTDRLIHPYLSSLWIRDGNSFLGLIWEVLDSSLKVDYKL